MEFREIILWACDIFFGWRVPDSNSREKRVREWMRLHDADPSLPLLDDRPGHLIVIERERDEFLKCRQELAMYHWRKHELEE